MGDAGKKDKGKRETQKNEKQIANSILRKF